MNFALSVSPSKEMGNRTRQRKKSPTSVRIEQTTSVFDRPLIALPIELQGQSREQVVGDCSGNCGYVNLTD